MMACGVCDRITGVTRALRLSANIIEELLETHFRCVAEETEIQRSKVIYRWSHS